MAWKEEYSDVVLVPSGLLIMFGYHLFLLYRCLKLPETTVIGYENHYRKVWIERILQVDVKERSPCLTVISSTISAATFFASNSLALSSLIGAWVGSTSNNVLESSLLYGDKSPSIISPSVLLLDCLCFFSPMYKELSPCQFPYQYAKQRYPGRVHAEGSYTGKCFLVGRLTAIHVAATLLLWIFGPIPMFASSVTMVVILHMLDTTPLHHFRPAKSPNLFSKIGDPFNCSQQP